MYTHTTGVMRLGSYCFNVPESGLIPTAQNCASKCTVLFILPQAIYLMVYGFWRCKDDAKESW